MLMEPRYRIENRIGSKTVKRRLGNGSVLMPIILGYIQTVSSVKQHERLL